MQTAIRIKTKVHSPESLTLSFPELYKLVGKEIEVIVLVDGNVDESSVPPKGLQNSRHIAGSVILDEEAVEALLNNRFK